MYHLFTGTEGKSVLWPRDPIAKRGEAELLKSILKTKLGKFDGWLPFCQSSGLDTTFYGPTRDTL